MSLHCFSLSVSYQHLLEFVFTCTSSTKNSVACIASIAPIWRKIFLPFHRLHHISLTILYSTILYYNMLYRDNVFCVFSPAVHSLCQLFFHTQLVYIYTLTGHFISYNLLVLELPFNFTAASTRS